MKNHCLIKNQIESFKMTSIKRMPIIRFMLLGILFVLLIPARGYSQTATAPSAGDGSSGSPYEIATLENLYWISVNASTPNDKYFIQTADIDAASTSGWTNGWIPIGCYGGGNITAFNGSYNGQGHVISNLYSTSGLSTLNWGLFGVSNGAIISNLGLTNVNITGVLVIGGTGALAGRTTGGSITNCYSTGSVTAKGMAGGLVGDLEGSTVTGCFSSCTATITGASDNYVGGFAGRIVSNAIVTKCYATGSTFSQYGYQGGFVGSTETTPIITDCYATGNSSCTTPYLMGGFVGYISGGTVSNCYSTGTVPASGNFIGGFSGYGAADNCFWDTETSGKATSSSGVGRTTAQMKTQSTFSGAGWNFTTPIWLIVGSNNNGYPYLVWQQFVAVPTISSFTPTSAATGATVTITGTNFTGATAVSFGGTAATSFSEVNSTTITAVVGSGTTGSVSVTNPDGTATLTGFTYLAEAQDYIINRGDITNGASYIYGYRPISSMEPSLFR